MFVSEDDYEDQLLVVSIASLTFTLPLTFADGCRTWINEAEFAPGPEVARGDASFFARAVTGTDLFLSIPLQSPVPSNQVRVLSPTL
jgi:hypothetical protein